jgi:hypothetical protein
MRPESSEFSLDPDRALGAALRAALDRPGDAWFASAVLVRARVAGVGSSRAVLARWTTRVAVAAALVAAVVGGVLVGTLPPAPASYDAAWVAAATGSSVAAALVTAERAPDASVLFASVAEE